MRKDVLKNMAGICLFYFIIILGVIAINARFEYLNSEVNTNNHVSLQP